MNRETDQPFNYASLADLQKALLVQMRRFNAACREIVTGALNPISLGPLKNSEKVTVTKKNSHNLDQLELLRNQLRLLKNMRGQLFTSFANDPKARVIRKSIEDLIENIAGKLDNLQQTISDAAEEKINPGVKRITNSVVKELTEDLKLKPNQIGYQYFLGLISPPGKTEANINAEVVYVLLKNIKTIDGYAAESFVIAIGFPNTYAKNANVQDSLVETKTRKPRTGEEEQTTKALIYIALLTGFKIPSKIRWQGSVTETGDVKKIIHDLLTTHGIISSSEKRSLPVTKESINFAHDNIQSTTVRGDYIEVKVKDVKDIDATANELRMQLKSIVDANNPKNKDLIRTKVMRDNGVIRFVFSLPANLKGRLVDNNLLNKIKQILNLTPEELIKIKTALEDHE